MRRTIRKLMAEARAEAEAAKAKAEAVSPWALFRARRRRWARAAGRGAAREPVGAAGWGRRRPGAPLWCGFCSSPTPVLGAAGPGSTKAISLGFVPRTEAPLGTSSGDFFGGGLVLLSPLQSTPQKKKSFFKYGILKLWRRGLSRHTARYLQPTFLLRIALDFAENGPFFTPSFWVLPEECHHWDFDNSMETS